MSNIWQIAWDEPEAAIKLRSAGRQPVVDCTLDLVDQLLMTVSHVQIEMLKSLPACVKYQWTAKRASGKGPRQRSSKSVKNVFDTFRQLSRRAKNVKTRQKVSNIFSTLFARHQFSGPFEK